MLIVLTDGIRAVGCGVAMLDVMHSPGRLPWRRVRDIPQRGGTTGPGGDGLGPAKGMLLAVGLGAVLWAVVGLLIWSLV